jgi:tetratricopeptide (TPR) repeat protein
VERFFGQAEYGKAMDLLDTMCDESANHDDHADVHLWLGRCRAKLGQNKEAVEEFDAALKLLPDYAEVYRYRAEAYQQLGEKEKAGEDEKKFRELGRK